MEEDENDENAPEERDSGKRKSKDMARPAEVEKKKKRKIGAVAPLAPAFDFNGFLVSLPATTLCLVHGALKKSSFRTADRSKFGQLLDPLNIIAHEAYEL